MKVTSKGQVTIPGHIRKRMGIVPQTDVEFVVEGNTVVLRTVESPSRSGRGSQLVASLRGKATVRMTTDEIMKLTRGE